MAYDRKFREKVLKYISKGHTVQEAHAVFEAGTTTIHAWKKLQLETGSLEKRPLERTHKKIDPVELKAYLANHPDSFLREIAAHFNCTENAVFLAMKRLRITRKKNQRIR